MTAFKTWYRTLEKKIAIIPEFKGTLTLYISVHLINVICYKRVSAILVKLLLNCEKKGECIKRGCVKRHVTNLNIGGLADVI
jgi:hypothetical protein